MDIIQNYPALIRDPGRMPHNSAMAGAAGIFPDNSVNPSMMNISIDPDRDILNPGYQWFLSGKTLQ
jgi:hypothetical protein